MIARHGRASAALLSALLLSSAGCGPIPDYRTLVEADIHPPDFLGIDTTDARTVVVRFDESVSPIKGAVSVAPEVQVAEVAADGAALRIRLDRDQQIGADYTLEAAVSDGSGNSTTLLTHFYGFNPTVPRLVINEFTTQGSDTHPDSVELFAGEAGNLAGVCLYEGMSDVWDDRYVFPSVAVEAGEYVIVHFKPQGIPQEISETTDRTASGGYDSSPLAFDEWVSGGDGLSGNNGVLSLYSSPGGRLLDAVLYSNRTSTSDTDYGGFGSKTLLDQATALAKAGAWSFAGDRIAPEDAVNPTGSTATRSICRDSHSADTNGRSDWHIVPTSGFTFGVQNSDAVYVP